MVIITNDDGTVTVDYDTLSVQVITNIRRECGFFDYSLNWNQYKIKRYKLFKMYNAVYHATGKQSFITFNNYESLTFFLLKWS